MENVPIKAWRFYLASHAFLIQFAKLSVLNRNFKTLIIWQVNRNHYRNSCSGSFCLLCAHTSFGLFFGDRVFLRKFTSMLSETCKTQSHEAGPEFESQESRGPHTVTDEPDSVRCFSLFRITLTVFRSD